MLDDPTLLSISQAGRALRSGEISVEALVASYLDRVANSDDILHSYTVVLADEAMAWASQLDNELARGRDRGPLHGIPVAVKDIFDSKDAPTTMGSRLFANHLARVDGHTIETLHDAGAVLLGVLSMDEFALGVTGTNALFPRCVNPHDAERISGGSSSGCGCATAARLCLASLGTDTAGSIRVPAALCGVVGLKPTYGRVSKRGVLPLSWSLDHVGPLTRSVTDAWLMLQAIAHPDIDDPCSAIDAPGLGTDELGPASPGIHVGLAVDGIFSDADPDVIAAVEDVAQRLASAGVQVERVLIDVDVPGGIISTEASVLYGQALSESPELFGSRVRDMLTTARDRPVRYYAESRRQQDALRRVFERVLQQVDVIITPTTPMAAPKFDGLDIATISRIMTRYTGPVNLAGLPALSVPCGTTTDNLPIGMQIIGRRWAERQVCNVGICVERIFGEDQ